MNDGLANRERMKNEVYAAEMRVKEAQAELAAAKKREQEAAQREKQNKADNHEDGDCDGWD